MSDQKTFIRITDQIKKNEILTYLIQNKIVIHAKTINPDSELYLLQATSLVKNTLICRASQTVDPKLKSQPFIIQFLSGVDKYIYQTNCNIESSTFTFETNADLFQIQRREDFRLRIPENYKGIFQIKKINSSIVDKNTRLLDLSTGGIRFEAPLNTKLKIGDQISGEIKLSHRDTILAGGEVKHLIPHSEDFTTELVGVQFSNLVTTSENKIFAVIMDVYRELFSKLN